MLTLPIQMCWSRPGPPSMPCHEWRKLVVLRVRHFLPCWWWFNIGNELLPKHDSIEEEKEEAEGKEGISSGLVGPVHYILQQAKERSIVAI